MDNYTCITVDKRTQEIIRASSVLTLTNYHSECGYFTTALTTPTTSTTPAITTETATATAASSTQQPVLNRSMTSNFIDPLLGYYDQVSLITVTHYLLNIIFWLFVLVPLCLFLLACLRESYPYCPIAEQPIIIDEQATKDNTRTAKENNSIPEGWGYDLARYLELHSPAICKFCRSTKAAKIQAEEDGIRAKAQAQDDEDRANLKSVLDEVRELRKKVEELREIVV